MGCATPRPVGAKPPRHVPEGTPGVVNVSSLCHYWQIGRVLDVRASQVVGP
ncbi:hypothetical protein HMPREF9057_00707 [Actinomyces sp. oral taxon 171 str. F0337]|nr:hypothetical protein HMPREF9057_00707 [Actinomyces sp. oral taxon 171 str. F0337]